MNSFLIRNRRSDSDLRSNVIPILIREKSLIFWYIFTVCILIDVSKGETSGTGFANWKMFFAEQSINSTKETRK